MGPSSPQILAHPDSLAATLPRRPWMRLYAPPSSRKQVDLEDAHNIAQIIQGAAFIFLVPG